MDVYLKDKNRVINVEMQTTNKGDLPRRARYYQAAADIDNTPKGSEYKDLKENVVIFICTFDPFHCGKAIYHFENYCINHPTPIPLRDGTSKLFLNTVTENLCDLDLDLQLFYDYVRGRPAQTDFTKELDKTIAQMKEVKEERNMYLTYTTRIMESRRDGFDEGLHTGREEGISIGLATGREQGAYEKALETARIMYLDKVPIETISKYTNLPLDVIQTLQ